MGRTWRLNRTTQCTNCPWKVSSKVADIPNYQRDLHEKLGETIATGVRFGVGTLNIMACHDDHENHCIGWMRNQLGSGNNIALRIGMMSCENAREIKTIGKQHQSFAETFGYDDDEDLEEEDENDIDEADYIDDEDDEDIYVQFIDNQDGWDDSDGEHDEDD